VLGEFGGVLVQISGVARLKAVGNMDVQPAPPRERQAGQERLPYELVDEDQALLTCL
jgi:hypothetical protein